MSTPLSTPNAIAGYTIGALIGACALVITILIVVKKWAKHEGATLDMVLLPHKNLRGRLPEWGLFLYRVLALGFCGSTMIYGLEQQQSLKFYTLWNFGLLCFYFLSHVIVYILFKRGVLTQNEQLQYFVTQALIVLFEVVLCMCLLVDSVYWGLLYGLAPNPADIIYTTIVMHGMNFPIMIAEFCLNDIPYRPADVIFTIDWAVCWMYFQFVWETQTGEWIYYFTDVTESFSALWYIGLVLYHVVAFYIMYGFFLLKMRGLKQVPYYREPKTPDVEMDKPMKAAVSNQELFSSHSSEDNKPEEYVPVKIDTETKNDKSDWV